MTSVVDVEPFDVFGPLPTGTTVLEASAGTGKTLHDRGARHPLRRRGRRRAARADARHVQPGGNSGAARAGARTAGRPPSAACRPVACQARPQRPACWPCSPTPRTRRSPDVGTDSPARWLTFDAATIATTHGFCLQMLAGLGMAGDLEPDATFVEDVDDLVVEVVGDLYLRRFAAETAEPALRPAHRAHGRPGGDRRPAGNAASNPSRRTPRRLTCATRWRPRSATS